MSRETRGSRGRLVFFTTCLAVGVAAVVAVAGLSDALDRGIRSQARELLAADIAVVGRAPAPAAIREVLGAEQDVRTTTVKEMTTVIAGPGQEGVPGRSLVVDLKVVGPDYPLYGTVHMDEGGSLGSLLGTGNAVVGPELLSRLGLSIGDAIRVGDADFRIAGTVISEPDRVVASFNLGPRVFLSDDGLARAGLERFGSRIEHRFLIAVGDAAGPELVKPLAGRLRAALPPGGWYKVETASEAQPALRGGIRRAERFLGLVALVSLLVGGIGIAQTVRAWIAGRLDAIAVQRCIGMTPGEVGTLYVGQTLLLAAAGCVVGAVVGVGMIAVAAGRLQALVPNATIEVWQPMALLRGSALGLGVALLFGGPPLVAVRRVPPVRVLRHDAEILPPSRPAAVAAGVVLVLGVFGTAWVQSGSPTLGAFFAGGVLAATGALALGARAVQALASAIPRRVVAHDVRHGLSALARPGAGTLGSIVAIGLGVLVVLGTWLVQARLVDRLRADLPAAAPTAFFIDVQPDQMSGVETLLLAEGATEISSVPIVVARLAAVDGRAVSDLASEARDEGRARWVLTREQRLTWLHRLPDDNRVVEGALWSDPDRAEASVEIDFARDLGVSLGSSLTFDVQGVPVEVVVTSLRTVEWRTFGINFFLVIEPGVLDEAPQATVAAARLPENREQEVQDRLAALFPNVTMLRIRDILTKVVTVLDQLGQAVRLLGLAIVFAGVAILAGAIGAASIRRRREVALLKALGMTRWGVVRAFALEYAFIGAVAGGIGAVGAGVLSWAVLTFGMEIGWEPGIAPYGIAVLASAALAVVAGIGASGRALASRPVDVLRSVE